jgi:hypothetical protein
MKSERPTATGEAMMPESSWLTAAFWKERPGMTTVVSPRSEQK